MLTLVFLIFQNDMGLGSSLLFYNTCHPELGSGSQGLNLLSKVCQTDILKLIYSYATIAERTINVMQYDNK